MASVDVSRCVSSLLEDAETLSLLPHENSTSHNLRDALTDAQSSTILDTVANLSLNYSRLTDRLFVHFENVFPDICARWLALAAADPSPSSLNAVVCAFGRILAFAPHVSVLLERALEGSKPQKSSDTPSHKQPHIIQLAVSASAASDVLTAVLLAAWRLNNFSQTTYGNLFTPSFLQSLFKHESRQVRYLAVRVFCQLLHAADKIMETLVREHVGGADAEAIASDFDGEQIDFLFLSIHERSRVDGIANRQAQRTVFLSTFSESSARTVVPQSLTQHVVAYGHAMLPRPLGPSKRFATLIPTPTTLSNLEHFAQLLQQPGAILLHGLPGTGKTALVREIAEELDMLDQMVTLHLNEQTDAKMLIGLYTTDTKPGSFTWRPGVLTTAVRQGRWVLIEDLDRAPAEVISTLLPLIERGELLIPSRGEKIKASNSFRLFATVRTTKGMNGRETLPHLLGLRFWQLLSVQSMSDDELRDVIEGLFPSLHKLVPIVLAVYNNLSRMGSSAAVASSSRGLLRQMSLRDLLKWCRRLSQVLVQAGCVSGNEPISESTRNSMFQEAIDCFLGHLPDVSARDELIFLIGREMHMSKETVEHYLVGYVPPLQDKLEDCLKVGRACLEKRRKTSRLATGPRRPFANTVHAKRLLEQISVSVKLREPVLLVGETGIGKTSVVQQLSDVLGHKLAAVNLSQQSEVGDLLGGFKPVNTRTLAVPLKEEFEDLFAATGISRSKNQVYLDKLGKCFAKGQWSRVSKLWREAPKMFVKILQELTRRHQAAEQPQEPQQRDEDGKAIKRRKVENNLSALTELQPRWEAFSKSLDQFDMQISAGQGGFAFSFVEGNIIKAVRNGDWILLDEINLASPDTLESIADLLTDSTETPSILLSESGEIERVTAHPNFRVFAAMNPATDVGKRDLPIGIRSRFTEIYVNSPDSNHKDLLEIVKSYLRPSNVKDEQAADDITRLYLQTKELAAQKRLVDGANEVPHFSLRTLTRVLDYVVHVAPVYGLRRALFEGFSMGFLTLLNGESEKLLIPKMFELLFGRANAKALLSQPPKQPTDGRAYIRFSNGAKDRHYWLVQGEQKPVERTDYIVTPSVERNLLNLVRATSTRRYPILIQGPTSAGKTSMIEYLAQFSGNRFVRINNHEHTDLQEYVGTYVSGSDGKLRFQEGLLVQAMRNGYWIVLDELNLAPTDVLEALNRLLDDNRELMIPETQEVVRPHENFMLFATQNPPGLYGGRKVLSRAFRNRFLELHYDDIPESELEAILQRRSKNTSPSDCRRIVNVYRELSRLRQTSRLFEQKDSFATLRDLFRWALRNADTREQIANNGFMLLAERVRDAGERDAVRGVIEKEFRVKISPEQLYATDAPVLQSLGSSNSQGVVWTHAMRRLYVLVAEALRNNEPVLLVGDTGCGKTTVCQVLAEAVGKQLHIVNAHQNTETGDLIGSQRPVRNRQGVLDALDADVRVALDLLDVRLAPPASLENHLAALAAVDAELLASHVPLDLRERITANQTRSKALFEWSDGSLVHAMKTGQFFLLDEISLADDSVLERLNSVLEPARTLLLAEKGVDNSFVTGAEGFQFFATMNPGGDFGKKELSPALRNRFTEIWVPPLAGEEDILQIVRSKLRPELNDMAPVVVAFSSWFAETFRATNAATFSIREVLVWVQFMNKSLTSSSPDTAFGLVHGAATVFIDSLGANPSAMIALNPATVGEQRVTCLSKLGELLGRDISSLYDLQPELTATNDALTISGFSVPRLPAADNDDAGFAFHAPTTRLNTMRVVRALSMQKPILLEGSPGVGKTTLVAALAKACGQPLTRINLSDQTDLMDLFGTDVPVEGEEAGNFAWRDAPFLQAMQKGEWVLLDEMNLASQSVLEGLNACLDHRGEVYISELDQVFKRHPDFRLFAAQNPHHQGGGRKGLPSSFVNRFIVVYADSFSPEDLLLIAQHSFPAVDKDTVEKLIAFISLIEKRVVQDRAFGALGGPWEFNLRDTLRWLRLLSSKDPLLSTARVSDFFDMLIGGRFRSENDRMAARSLFEEIFGIPPAARSLYHDLSHAFSQVGMGLLPRDATSQPEPLRNIDITPQLPQLEAMMVAVQQGQPVILSGPSGSGKSALIAHLAGMAGKELVTFALNADVDTMDLVGGFEQHDPLREVNAALKQLHTTLQASVLSVAPAAAPQDALSLLTLLAQFRDGRDIPAISACAESLAAQISSTSVVGVQLAYVIQLLSQPLEVANPRFEWLDGVIIRALEAGSWLVLDNANLCAASVLDRLNSLLEPDGFVSINEHCGADGEPRIVRPQPGFHIFLTMDPRYGELSRAMRNRAIEIHLLAAPTCLMPKHLGRVASVEAKLQRLQQVVALAKPRSAIPAKTQSDDADAQESLTQLAAQGLAMGDVELLHRFIPSAGHRVLSAPQRKALDVFVATLHSDGAQDLWTEVEKMYTLVSDVISPSVVSAQPVLSVRNSPLVPLLTSLSSSSGLAQWLTVWYGYHQELLAFNEAIAVQAASASPARLSSLNRFQRSFLVLKGGTKIKDATAGVAKFLHETFQVIQAYLRAPPGNEADLNSKKHVLRLVIHHLQRTFAFVTAATFDDAAFQAHMALGNSLAVAFASTDVDAVRGFATSFHDCMAANFSSGFNLTTGLWMEELWRAFRPMPLANDVILGQTSALTKLAMRFDALRWKAKAPVKDLSKAAATLCTAYGLVRRSIAEGGQDVSSLVDALTAEVATLEASIGGSNAAAIVDLPPFFSGEFEALRQLLLLDTVSMHPHDRTASVTAIADIATLASAPTFHAMLLHDAPPNSGVPALQLLDFVVCQGTEAKTIRGAFLPSLIGRLTTMGNANLDALSLLETELPILGRYLAAKTTVVVQDPVDTLNLLRCEITDCLLSAVVGGNDIEVSAPTVSSISGAEIPIPELTRPELWTNGVSALFDGPAFASIPSHVTTILKDHLAISLTAGHAAATQSGSQKTIFAGISWVQLALAALKLYVPDKTFDPQLRSALEIEAYNQLQAQLHAKLGRLIDFETLFTGIPTSVQVAGLKDEIAHMGPPPAADVLVFRPQRSELSQVQTEFGNIVKSILRSETMVSFMSTVTSTTVSKADIETPFSLISGNISHVIDRLAYRFDAYQDMIRPAINILRCLQVGLSLCSGYFSETSLAPDSTLPSNLALIKSTPFLGASRDASLPSYKGAAFEFLHRVTLTATIQGFDSFDTASREAVFQCFHTLYEDWKKKLESDQKEEAANQSVFHFKGSYEDEVERDDDEFNELFPTFDEEEDEFGNAISTKEPKKPESALANRLKVREMSIRVAEAHSKLLLNKPEAVVSMRELLKLVGRKAAPELAKSVVWEVPSTSARSLVSNKLLPAVMVDLHDSLESIMTSAMPTDYNFYTSAHLQEARAVVALVDRVKTFFRQLQQVDEIGHMQPLKDVILRCNKLLELGHTEPLAKLLPKVEQLHGTVYEWQFGGWASRIYQAPTLYDSLTKTITRWRSLELTTWARLLDMEVQKCVADARAWWFVAYQATIAVPGALLNGPAEHLEAYTAQLVADLQMYFSTAPIGQFEARLDLLKTMQTHLSLMCVQYPSLDAVHAALANFIAMQSRFSASISEHIAHGRAPIEKQMKMDVKLASWKDVNISALRESARKSHQKLFKHVRKFRGVLAQPMAPVIERGIPEEKTAVPVFVAPEIGLAETAPLLSAASGDVAEFLTAHRRLANAPKTVSLMAKAAAPPSTALPTPSSLNSFAADLLESITELRKETPEFLTEENKDIVKHLKARKRKLFADTLKDLKNMGLRYHHGTDALAAQSSSALVLASAKTLAEPAEGADFYWHKLVDLLPKARRTPNDHHAELTGGEVSRCVGFLEGILMVANNQRSQLSPAGAKLLALEARVDTIKNLAATLVDEPVNAVPTDTMQSHNLAWLTEILRFATQLVAMHAKLGGCDNSATLQSLDGWLKTFEDLRTREKALCLLPNGLSSTRALQLREDVAVKSHEFIVEVQALLMSRSDLEFVLQQLLGWSRLDTSFTPQSASGESDTLSVLDFAEELSLLCDKSLVAVEAYKKTAASLPLSTDTPGWFSTANKTSSAMFSALRPDELNSGLAKLTERLATMAQISTPASHATLSSLISLAIPILAQYSLIVRAAYERHLEMHSATVYLGWMLGRSYTQIASQGFCTPQEKSDEKADGGQEGELESGTGLGDGEGAEDISKDVEPDEDLTELAQEPNEKKDGDMEDNKDAIDMAGEELEGEDGSTAGDEEDDQKGDDGEEENDVDDEVGDVDDLDPTAVDEKMWDGEDEDEAEKDQQGNEAKGQQKNEEQAAEGKENDDKPKKDEQVEGADVEEDAPEEEDEDVQQAQDEAIRQDQNVEESEILGAPEDMDLDLQDMDEDSEEEEEELGDLDMDAGEEEVVGEEEKTEDRDGKMNDEEKPEDDEETGEAETAVDDADDNEKEEEDPEEEADIDMATDEPVDMEEDVKQEEDEEENKEDAQDQQTDDSAAADNVAPSEVQSGGQDQNADSMDAEDSMQGSKDMQEDGGQGNGADEREADAGTQGATTRPDDSADAPDSDTKDEDDTAAEKSEPFRKLGDALEQWHRQKREIKDPGADDLPKEQTPQDKNEADAQEMQQQEFQHLQDDAAVPDAQAIGAATEDEVQPIDDAMAIDDETEDPASKVQPVDDSAPPADEDVEEGADADAEMKDAEASEAPEVSNDSADDPRTGVKTRTGAYNKDPTPEPEDLEDLLADKVEPEEPEIEETSTQLSATHLDADLLDFSTCLTQWDSFTTSTFALSQSLTAQLRLILTPSQSTKLSGAFRTGKRLAIKRIIPYIASSYKRDKIWLRRAVPTKRSYQILIAVDDSKSMGESGSGVLALQSLVMVSRALAALEVGQVGVLSFGADVVAAHDLAEPFSSADAGARALQRFRFAQDRTDVRLLIRRTIDTFKAARLANPAAGSEDLWQLALILSDGITPSSEHDAIRRLLREAVEERIMVVFIIMDDAKAKNPSNGGGISSSVLDLKFSSFVKDAEGNAQVVMGRYLDTFPFQYYLIVHHLDDLPGALAGLLRTWFAEVAA
ncbi:hypothetical protein BROUX41_002431 [Berkeleyomyces rouxiae]|uniref:uncharacterized protein n=1 Tax=Berkeleyomyces rouxiae TaxID=2035830 RepID=UPI003B7E0170